MTPPIVSTLSNLFASISTKSSESDVEENLVLPLLHILDYEDEDWQQQMIIGRVRLDFQVQPQQAVTPYPPYLVIETKAPSKNINRSAWQINGYMRRSGAILGLLTNGYRFRLLYNYHGQVETLQEYSQVELIKKFNFFRSLLCKNSCLKVISAFYKNQDKVHINFLKLIANKISDEKILNIFTNKSKPGYRDINPEEKSSVVQLKKYKSMIITVFNNKGGVGKTTMTINLGAALSKMGYRVLLIDIDPQANLTTGLKIDPLTDVEYKDRKDITHLLTEPKTPIEETIFSKRWNNVRLDIVPSHIRLSDMEIELSRIIDVDRILAKKLKKYQDQYDYVFIDPPPSFGKVNNISLMASSAILIPTQLAPYPIRALEYVINRAVAVDNSREDPLPILGICVSMYDRTATKQTVEMTERIREILGKKPESKNLSLFPDKTWIPRLTVVANSPDKGYPLCFAEFDSQLDTREKETAEDAFSCYTELAKYLISIT